MALALVLAAPVLAQTQGGKAEPGAREKEQARTAIQKDAADFERAWNRHDPKAMAMVWAEDATLINPAGERAVGREQITDLFAREQKEMFGKSRMTLRVDDLFMVRSDVAFADLTATVDGATDREGKPLPRQQFHVGLVSIRAGDDWQPIHIRPYVFLPTQPSPGSGGDAP